MSAGQIQRVEEMPIYGVLMSLALNVEGLTRGFPSDFRWLRVQALKSSESAVANLTEGFYAQYSTEYLQSLYRARREARETTTHLQYAAEAGLIQQDTLAAIHNGYNEAMQQLAGLIRSIEIKLHASGKAKPAPGLLRESCSPGWQIDFEHTDIQSRTNA